MKILIYSALIVTSFFFSGFESLMGGQARLAPIEDFYEEAALVVIVDVKKVTKVEVSTGDNQATEVYVAEAEVLETLKSDRTPTPIKRKIAIVGSTIPSSSAVWEPIESSRYLAFLNPIQGHYSFTEKYEMRRISPEGKVAWIEKNAKGDYELINLDIEEATKRIRAVKK